MKKYLLMTAMVQRSRVYIGLLKVQFRNDTIVFSNVILVCKEKKNFLKYWILTWRKELLWQDSFTLQVSCWIDTIIAYATFIHEHFAFCF